MEKTVETTTQMPPRTQRNIEEAVEEALFVADFFGFIVPDSNKHPLNLSTDSQLADYLETAHEHIDSLYGEDELRRLIFLTTKRG